MISTVDNVIFIAYFLFLALIGYYCRKLVKTSKDFVIAGRKLRTLMTTATLVATAIGAFPALGLSGLAYRAGIAAYWLIIAWSVGWAFIAIVSPRLWRTGCTSLPAIFKKRYGKSSMHISGLIILIYVVYSLAAQIAALGIIFTIIGLPFGITYEIGVIVGMVIVVTYTILGGLFAVAYTDLFQFSLIIVTIVFFLPIFSFWKAGGWTTVIANLQPQMLDFQHGLPALIIVGWFVKFALSAASNPPYIQRTLAAKTPSIAARSQWLAIIIHGIIPLLIILSAMAGKLIFPLLENPEHFVPTMIITKFPIVAAGLGIAGLLSIILSTAGSYLLLAGTTSSIDIYAALRPGSDEKSELRFSRVATLFWGIVALILALWVKSVLILFAYAAAAYGASMFFPFFACLFWKKATTQGANTGMVIGASIAIIWNQLLMMPLGVDGVIVGSILCGIAVCVVSLATYKKAFAKVT